MFKQMRQFFSGKRQDQRKVRTSAESQVEDMKNAPAETEERKKFDEKSFKKSQESNSKSAPTDQTL